MKTFFVVLAAAVLAAVLAWVLICYFLPCPSPEPKPDTRGPELTCEDYIGRGPREAVAKVKMDTEDRRCKLKTIPNRLDTCVGDELSWEAAYVGDCTEYSGDLVIRLKEGEDERDLEIIETGPRSARARVPDWPAKCERMTKCTLEYVVVLNHTDPNEDPLVEDPNIDIWK